jgi:hypothetical protein
VARITQMRYFWYIGQLFLRTNFLERRKGKFAECVMDELQAL